MNDKASDVRRQAEELLKSVSKSFVPTEENEKESSPEQEPVERFEKSSKKLGNAVTTEIKKTVKESVKEQLLPKEELPFSPGTAYKEKPLSNGEQEKSVTVSEADNNEPQRSLSSGERKQKAETEPSVPQTVHAKDEHVQALTPQERTSHQNILKQPSEPSAHKETSPITKAEPLSNGERDLHVRKIDSGVQSRDENPELAKRKDTIAVSENNLRTEEEMLHTSSERQNGIHAVKQTKLNTAAPSEQLHRGEDTLPTETEKDTQPENPQKPENKQNSTETKPQNQEKFSSENSVKLKEDRPQITVQKAKEENGSVAIEKPFDPSRRTNDLNQKKIDNSLNIRTEREIPLESDISGAPLSTLESESALASSGEALHTAGFTEAGQATAGAMETTAEAAGGAATGGATVAVKVGKKILDKIKEQFLEVTQNKPKEKSSGNIGSVLLVALVIISMPILCVAAVLSSITATNVNLSDEVNSLMPLIQAACEENGIPEYAPLVAAVMMQESGGRADAVGGDVMQCAEAMGYPVGTSVPVEESINFGTRLLASYLAQAGCSGVSDIPSISLAIQSYNFGGGFLSWALARGGYTKENAVEFSNQQAAIMGWSSYGDVDYVDHVLRYYQVVNGMGATMGDQSLIANGMFSYPLDGYTWTTYEGHEGIDIPVEVGTPVYACANGTVIYTQGSWDSSMGVNGVASYGNCIFIDNGAGWQTRYAHLSSVVVSYGETVVQGQLIGYSGNTGNSTGPHVHLAIYYNGSPSSGGVIYAEQAWPQYKAGG